MPERVGAPGEIYSGPKTLLELKARCPNPAEVQAWCDANADHVEDVLQVDTYFRVNRGRLKIREVVGQETVTLIYYSREDRPTPKRSRVFLLHLGPGTNLKHILDESLGILVVVEKRRTIYRWGRVQIHLDRVARLGDFIEFERLVEGPDEEVAAQAEYDALRAQLHVLAKDLIAESYSDLLVARPD